ncbi:hypothetical protein INR49_003426 [Caranx melampygus]|nr:hypothetical protein INR49_003426 [Caranx melampygus]
MIDKDKTISLSWKRIKVKENNRSIIRTSEEEEKKWRLCDTEQEETAADWFKSLRSNMAAH